MDLHADVGEDLHAAQEAILPFITSGSSPEQPERLASIVISLS